MHRDAVAERPLSKTFSRGAASSRQAGGHSIDGAHHCICRKSSRLSVQPPGPRRRRGPATPPRASSSPRTSTRCSVHNTGKGQVVMLLRYHRRGGEGLGPDAPDRWPRARSSPSPRATSCSHPTRPPVYKPASSALAQPGSCDFTTKMGWRVSAPGRGSELRSACH